jgi:large repetitive protein
MSAIEFVVRSDVGAVNRGFVGGEGVSAPLMAQAGSDISLKLERTQILSYGRRGQALEITLIDGQVIVIDDFFAMDGTPQSDLFISTDGLLTEVDLAAGPGDTYFSTYVDSDSYGKWGPDDELVFLDGPAIQLAGVPDDEVGMLGTGFLTGLPLLPIALLGAAATLLPGGSDGETVLPDTEVRPDPEGEILEGTVESGTIVNAEDHADGVDIVGTGTPGATVVVTIGDATQETVIDEDGDWSVTFPTDDIDTGTYETPVVVVIADDGREITIEETLSVDTEASVTFDEDAVGVDGTVNAAEAGEEVLLTGTTEAGSTVVVTVNGVDYDATVVGENWTVSLPAATLPEGELIQGVTVTATDHVGNTAVTTGDFVIDTETNVAIATATIGGNGVVNAQEHASGFTVTGTAEAGASVVVTLGPTSHTVTATAEGTWAVYFSATEVPAGTYVATVTAVATDLAGNTATASGTIQIDTEMSVTVDTASVEGDGVVNAAEASDGVTITGTAEAGAAVTVVLGSITQTATAAADGTWSVTYAASQLAGGTYTATVQVSATDAAGNTATTSGTLQIDTSVRITFNAGAVGGDGTVSAEEAGSVVLTGTTDAGSTVVVTMNGTSYTATVTGTTWSLSVPAADIRSGDYLQSVTVTATDPAGNTASTTGSFDVDTETFVTVSTSTVEGDGLVNAQERADGVTLTGTAEAGATVEVTMAGVTKTVTASANGTWSADFASSEVPPGERTAEISVIATDLVGNIASATGSIGIDTITTVTVNTATVGGDGTVNAAEREGGVTLTGTAEAGASVAVTMAGVTKTVTATANGTWSANFTAAEVPQGERSAAVSVTSTDLAGNTATATGTVAIDTVTSVTVNTATVGGDGTVNAAEREGGVTLTGTAEAGASVEVTMAGVTKTVTASANGTWSANFTAAEVPQGERSAAVSVTSTDLAGNTATATGTVAIDTVTSVTVNTATVGGDGTVNAAEREGGVTLTGTAEAGASVEVTMAGVTKTVTATANGTWSADFTAAEVPQGERTANVSVTSTDLAGNTATATGTVAIDTVTTVAVDTSRIETDGIVNAVERADGITLTGTAEAGASVAVTMAGVTRTVTAGANGTWSANFTAAEIPTGETTAAVSVTATDAAGNTATDTDTVRIDTFVNALDVTSGPVGGDGVVNLAEQTRSITITGIVEPGSTVVVTLAGVTATATVAANGNWTVSYPASSIPGGEYDTTLVVSATDAAGNTADLTQSVRVDTVAGDLTLSPEPIEGDDIVNAVEHADGVTIYGTATPGLTVTVTLGGATQQVVAGADGNWSTDFPAASIPVGTYNAPISATITDDAGNTKTVTDVVRIDTELPFTLTTPVEGDDIINGAEARDGVVLSGTVEPGATVVVTFAGTTRSVTAGSNGAWSISYPASVIPAGESMETITAVATDIAGNVEEITHTVRVDTIVNTLTIAGPIEGDDLVNRAEAGDGITLTGTVEVGSTVMVTFEGVTRAATVAANGNWTVSFTEAEIPRGEYTASVTINATDSVGNTRSITDSFEVDTTPPEAPLIESYTRSGQGVRALSTTITEDEISIHAINGSGQVSTVNAVVTENTVFNELDFNFTQTVPNGSHLVMNASDDSGNSTATLFVLEEANTNVVSIVNQGSASNNGLGTFDIEAIDLQFAEDSVLTLTAADLEALCAHSNTLTIHGGEDDTVNIIGARATGQTTQIGDQTYAHYTLGTNGGSLIIDETINVVT